jgi:serine/threonine protein kinase
MKIIAEGKGPPKYPESISPELEDFLSNCFKFEPSERMNVYELQQHPFLKDVKSTKAKKYKYHNGIHKSHEPDNSSSDKHKMNRKVTFDESNELNNHKKSPQQLSNKSILKNSGKNTPVLSPEATPESTSRALIDTDNERVKSILDLVAQKKLGMEDAMKILPESHVTKIKAYFAEQKKKAQLEMKEEQLRLQQEQQRARQAERDVAIQNITKRRSMLVENKNPALIKTLLLYPATKRINAIKEANTEEENASSVFPDNITEKSKSQIDRKKDHKVQRKSGFSNCDSSRYCDTPLCPTDRDPKKQFTFDTIKEEEHKLSHGSSSMNESEFDNGSSS